MSRLGRIVPIIYSGLIIFPFALLLGLSLISGWRYPEILPEYFGLNNWKDIVGSQTDLLTSFFISLFISVMVAFFSTTFGFVISRSLSYSKKGGRWYSLTYLPYIIAPVVLGACLSYFFRKLGIYGSMSGVIIAQILIATPYSTIFFSSFWSEKTKEYEGLNKTLGGSTINGWQRVILPIARGFITVCLFQTFLISWFEYGLTSIIGVGQVQTLTVKVFLYIKESNPYYGALACCLLILPPSILIVINRNVLIKKMI